MRELPNVPQRARFLGFKQYPRGTANTIGGCIRSAQAGANGARENICRHQVYFRYNCSSRFSLRHESQVRRAFELFELFEFRIGVLNQKSLL